MMGGADAESMACSAKPVTFPVPQAPNHPVMSLPPLPASEHRQTIKDERRGALAGRTDERAGEGYDVVKLNSGSPGACGFRMPATMRVAMVEKLPQAVPYSHQKSLFQARVAEVI